MTSTSLPEASTSISKPWTSVSEASTSVKLTSNLPKEPRRLLESLDPSSECPKPRVWKGRPFQNGGRRQFWRPERLQKRGSGQENCLRGLVRRGTRLQN